MLERLEAAGFQEIIPPTFEYAEVFVRAGGGAADVADRLIRFLDLDGKLLALRYDFTASVARLAATKLADWPTPLRLSYAGKVFRQDPEREGRRREVLQVGAERLGEGGGSAASKRWRPRCPRVSVGMSCTISGRYAGSTTTPGFTSSCSSPAPERRSARAGATTT